MYAQLDFMALPFQTSRTSAWRLIKNEIPAAPNDNRAIKYTHVGLTGPRNRKKNPRQLVVRPKNKTRAPKMTAVIRWNFTIEKTKKIYYYYYLHFGEKSDDASYGGSELASGLASRLG